MDINDWITQNTTDESEYCDLVDFIFHGEDIFTMTVHQAFGIDYLSSLSLYAISKGAKEGEVVNFYQDVRE